MRRLAKREGLSLNQAVLALARKGAGLDQRPTDDVVGDSLDAWIRTWTERDVKQMTRAVGLLDAMDAASQ